MAIITYPLNNIEYTAEDAELYHATRTSGVFANDDFPITVSGDGNVVTIGEGIGWIRNSKFSGKVVANKSEMSLDLGLPHATYPRIDAVVLQFSANANSSEIIVKNGTAQTDPMPPEVVRTESVYELHLYHVYREAGALSVTSSNVTDLRSDSSYCGIMSDDVTMLGDDYVRKDMVGVANGVASLDGSGKVPETQLPSMDYIPTSQKGVANGVATLDSSGRVPSGQLNLSSSVTSTSATTAANSYAVKQAYDKASSAGDAILGSGTISTGTSISEPISVTSSSIWYKKINGVTYIRVTAKCKFNAPSGLLELTISLTGLSTKLSDCIIGQINFFVVGNTIYTNQIKSVRVDTDGNKLKFYIYYEGISITSDQTVSFECSAILASTT